MVMALMNKIVVGDADEGVYKDTGEGDGNEGVGSNNDEGLADINAVGGESSVDGVDSADANSVDDGSYGDSDRKCDCGNDLQSNT